MLHAHSSINHTKKPNPKETRHTLAGPSGHGISGYLTRPESSNPLHARSNVRIPNLLGNQLHDPRRNHVHRKAKCRGMQEKFVHEHMRSHYNGKKHKKNNTDCSSILLRLVECQDAVEKWGRQEMHRQLVGWNMLELGEKGYQKSLHIWV